MSRLADSVEQEKQQQPARRTATAIAPWPSIWKTTKDHHLYPDHPKHPTQRLIDDQPTTPQPTNQPTSPKNNNQPSFTSNLPAIYQQFTSIQTTSNQHLPSSAIGHSLQCHLLMIFQGVLRFLNLLDEAGARSPENAETARETSGKSGKKWLDSQRNYGWMLDQWL